MKNLVIEFGLNDLKEIIIDDNKNKQNFFI